jgi:hypothetical protein
VNITSNEMKFPSTKMSRFSNELMQISAKAIAARKTTSPIAQPHPSAAEPQFVHTFFFFVNKFQS